MWSWFVGPLAAEMALGRVPSNRTAIILGMALATMETDA